MYQGAIFDLDGTLVNTIPMHEKCWQEIFGLHGVVLTSDELREQSGRTNQSFIEIINRRYGYDFDPQVLALEKDQIVLRKLAIQSPDALPGVIEFLAALKQAGVRMAIATTAGRNTAPRMGRQIWSYFEEANIVCREEIIKSKPDPEMFLTAAARLKLSSSECMVFEDAKNGVEAAKGGNFFCIAKDNHVGQDLSSADLIIDKYNSVDLMKYFI